mgnify:CR=1 FL=1
MIDVKASDFAERIKNIKGTVSVLCRSGKRNLMSEKNVYLFLVDT